MSDLLKRANLYLEKNEDCIQLQEAMCTSISVFYVNSNKVINNKLFLQFVLDFYTDKCQNIDTQEEIYILNFLYACTLYDK